MKIRRVIAASIAVMMMAGCAAAEVQPSAADENPEKEADEQVMPVLQETEESGEDLDTTVDGTSQDTARVYAAGPYGRLSVEIPEDWEYRICPAGSEMMDTGSYGIQLKPADEGDGYISVAYVQMFGVCGTGLEQEEVTLAGDNARIGTYDNADMWSFVSFQGKNEGIVAQNVMADTWTEPETAKVLEILDTMQYEPDVREGAMGYYKSDAELPEIGLIAEIKEASATGATIRFRVWDPELATGELEYGDDYSLEKMEGGEWIPVPIIFEGEWGINAIAYGILPEKDSEWTVDWEWLYGKLEPGDYRIGKSVMDFRGAGDYSQYRIYAYFVYGGEGTDSSLQHENNGEWLSLTQPENDDGEKSGNSEDQTAESGILAIEPESDDENNPLKDMDPEEYAESEEHWEWLMSIRDDVEQSSMLQEGMQDYYESVMRELLVTDSDENAVCSPLNIYFALAMLAEVSDGDTRQQILDVLNAETVEDLRENVQLLWNANTADTPSLTSMLGDSFWLRNDISYKEDTLQRLADLYHSSSFSGKMGSPEMDAALQKWTNEHTGNLLSEYVSGMSLNPQTVMALVSTIYYKAAWQDEFYKAATDKEIFHGTLKDSEADMMHRGDEMTYYEREHFTAIGLNLNDSGQMFFFLPEEGVRPEEVIADPQLFTVIRGSNMNNRYVRVNMTIPRFSVHEKLELTDALMRLGITDAFQPAAADFSPLTDDTDAVYVDDVQHAAMVEIDEEGVTGAAYTAILLDGAAAFPEKIEEVDFILDRPFAFVITGRDGAVLFSGIVNNIE